MKRIIGAALLAGAVFTAGVAVGQGGGADWQTARPWAVKEGLFTPDGSDGYWDDPVSKSDLAVILWRQDGRPRPNTPTPTTTAAEAAHTGAPVATTAAGTTTTTQSRNEANTGGSGTAPPTTTAPTTTTTAPAEPIRWGWTEMWGTRGGSPRTVLWADWNEPSTAGRVELIWPGGGTTLIHSSPVVVLPWKIWNPTARCTTGCELIRQDNSMPAGVREHLTWKGMRELEPPQHFEVYHDIEDDNMRVWIENDTPHTGVVIVRVGEEAPFTWWAETCPTDWQGWDGCVHDKVFPTEPFEAKCWWSPWPDPPPVSGIVQEPWNWHGGRELSELWDVGAQDAYPCVLEQMRSPG